MPGGAALFGGSASRSQNKNLVEFRAGKMSQKGKMVHPDKRKGMLYLHQSDDSLMHFCWKDRSSGTVEDDLIIFPDDCEYKKVNQCTTGRCFVLKFKSSNRKFFFWMQEPKTDKDEEYCRRVNEVLNNPPTPGSQRSGGGTPDGDLQNLLNNMSQQQLMQLFGGVGQMGGLGSLLGTMSRPSTGQSARTTSASGAAAVTTAATTTTTTTATTTGAAATTTTTATAVTTPPATTTVTAVTTASTPTTTTTTSGAGSVVGKGKAPTMPPAIQLRDLQNFLSGLNVPNPDASQQRSAVDLSSALTSDNLQAVLTNPGLARELQQHLPTVGEQPPNEQLRATLQSPQFQQALSMFSTALQSGQLGPVVQQFEVGDDAVSAANQGNMEDFIKALQKLESKEAEKKKEEGKKDEKMDKDDDDDEGMSLD